MVKKKRKYQVGGVSPEPQQGKAAPGPVNSSDKDVLAWWNSYVNSPKYKERLSTFWNDPSYVQQQRAKLIKNVGFTQTQGMDQYQGQLVPKMNTMYSNDSYFPNQMNVNVDQLKSYGIKRNEAVAHELGHGVNAGPWPSLKLNDLEQKYIFNREKLAKQFPQYANSKDISSDLMAPGTATSDSHDAAPTENLSDVQALRYLMNKSGIYDARTQNITPELLQKVKNDPAIKKSFSAQRLFKNFDDKGLLDILNNIAYNRSNQQQQFAQSGGDLHYVSNGPDLPMENPANFTYQPIVRKPSSNPQAAHTWKQTASKVSNGLLGVLEGLDYFGNKISDAKANRDYNNQYLQSLYGKAQHNPNEAGLDNVPIISKNGGEMNVFDYPYKKGKYYQKGGNANGRYSVISDMMGADLIIPKGRRPKKKSGGSVDYTFLQDKTPYPSWAKPQGNMDIWGFESGGINYNRADTIGSFFPPQYFMDGGPIDYNQATGLDAIFCVGGGATDFDQSAGLDGVYARGGLTSAKAKEILRDGTAQGHPLTAKQKRYFGYIAGGGNPRAAHGGIPVPDNFYFPKAKVGGRPGWINEADGVDGIYQQGGGVKDWRYFNTNETPNYYNANNKQDSTMYKKSFDKASSLYNNDRRSFDHTISPFNHGNHEHQVSQDAMMDWLDQYGRRSEQHGAKYMDGGPIDYNQATGLDAIFCLGGGYTDFDQAIGLDGIYERGGYISSGPYAGGWNGADDYYQALGLDGQYKKGGIHIKPSHKGAFTAYKKRTGKTTEEALHSSDPHVRQMANFARNAKKWKHQNGGWNYYDMGGDMPTLAKFKTPVKGPAYTRIVDAHQNGGYNVGDVIDLTPDQIEHLQSQGYDFQLMDNPYSIK